jgi:GNAT superfamily N-acetyltransferase
MEQDEERAQIALMLAGAYANMDLVSKAALHEKLALYIYPIKDRHSFFVAACINDHEAMKIYRCDLIDNNKKVGYTIFKIYPGSCSAHIDYVHVSDKSVRGKGVGTALLRFTLETLKKLGCKEVALYADPYDSDRTFTESELQQKLLSFYARHGFWSKDGSRTLVHDFTKNISYAPKAKL